MRTVKKILEFLQKSEKSFNNPKFFDKLLCSSMRRLKILLTVYIILYPFVIILEHSYSRPLGKVNASIIETFILVLAVIWIMINKCMKEAVGKSKTPANIFRLYVFLIFISSALLAVNSFDSPQNSWPYLTVAICCAFFFPMRPVFAAALFSSVQSIFIVLSLLFHGGDCYTLMIVMTTTVTMFIGFVITNFQSHSHIINFERLQTAEERNKNFRHIFNLNPMPMYVLEYDYGTLLLQNPGVLDYYGYTAKQAEEMCFGFFESEHEWNEIKESIAERGKLNHQVVLQPVGSGRRRWNALNYEVIMFEGKKSILCTAVDFLEIKKMEQALCRLAITDALTGAYNKRKGIELFQEKLSEIRKTKNNLFVISVVINSLKRINEEKGINFGDELLIKLYNTLKHSIPCASLVFRSSGDEFTAVLTNFDVLDASLIADEINNILAAEDDNINLVFKGSFIDYDDRRTPKQILSSFQYNLLKALN